MNSRALSPRPSVERAPDGWNWTRLEALVSEVTDRAGDDHRLPVLSVTKHQGIVRAEDYFKKAVHGRDTSNYKVVRRGQFAYATIHLDEGSIGFLSDDAAGIVSPMYTVFDVIDQLEPKYLLSVLKSADSICEYRRLAEGTVNRRASISFKNFAALYLLHPPIAEQRKIAAILFALEKTIAGTKEVIDQLHVVKKAMMAELLMRGLPGRHTQFKQTEIGEVPEDWEVVPLERVLIDGPMNGLYKPAHLIGRGALIAGMSAIDGSTLRWEACRRAELEPVEAERFGLRHRDILVTRVYARIDGIGRFIIVPEPPECAVYESNMMRLRIDPRLALPEFVASHMGLVEIRKAIEQLATLGAQASINNSGIRALPLRLPPLSEQIQIMNILVSLNLRADCENRHLDQLQTLKSALMSVLLTGEIRVTPDETTP
jgi:type I restriction enzyme S subunit